MSSAETVIVSVTQDHIDRGTVRKDPVELAVLDATPGAIDAQDWFSDAESREMCVTVWQNQKDFRTLAFTFPPEAFDFINDFVDGKPVSPFTFTARWTA